MKAKFCITLCLMICGLVGHSQVAPNFHYGGLVMLDNFLCSEYSKYETYNNQMYKTYANRQMSMGVSTSWQISKHIYILTDILFSQKNFPKTLRFMDGYNIKDSTGNIIGIHEGLNEGCIKLQNIELDNRFQFESHKILVNMGLSNFYPIFSRVRAAIPNPERKSNLGFFPDDNIRIYQTLNAGIGKRFEIIKGYYLLLNINYKYQLRNFDYYLPAKSHSIGLSVKIMK